MTTVTYMDHDQDYPADYLATILKDVKTIAMVGASSDPTKFSYGVLRVLHETGYDMIPVNPSEAGGEIRGLRVYESLAAINRPVDMEGRHEPLPEDRAVPTVLEAPSEPGDLALPDSPPMGRLRNGDTRLPADASAAGGSPLAIEVSLV